MLKHFNYYKITWYFFCWKHTLEKWWKLRISQTYCYFCFYNSRLVYTFHLFIREKIVIFIFLPYILNIAIIGKYIKQNSHFYYRDFLFYKNFYNTIWEVSFLHVALTLILTTVNYIDILNELKNVISIAINNNFMFPFS